MSALLTLVGLGLAAASFVIVIAVAFGYEARLRGLARRIQALEGRTGGGILPVRPTSEPGHLLQGCRVEVAVDQDHPLLPFAALLRETLTKEGAVLVETGGEVRVVGTLKGNGYADVYFRAELTASAGDEALFALSERPPHGDRPENLAREVVARLRDELAKRERRGALRELGL